ncbi:MAG TPA: GTPase ObgE [Acidimicrobiales bacterium]|nr:GTPase ObgE [Acidimicrobiales bacterium]
MSGFVDEAQVNVRGGDGGAGAVSFRREAHVSRGGPDGGDGGKGGDVWLVASYRQASLLGFRDHPHRRASSAKHGGGKRRHGAAGADLEVEVPVGTVVRSKQGGALADLAAEGDRWLAAVGGRGGKGNARFLSNRRRAPGFAEQGESGEERWLDLELKLVADVALVGFPNAGKSTLISRISAARPKIADYPFTTLEPHLGVVRTGRPGSETELVVADVPGLVEGAADGKGLGHRFLRHVERARVLLLLLDPARPDGPPPAQQAAILLRELRRYRAELLERPRIVVGSKSDSFPLATSGSDPSHDPVDLWISSLTGVGLEELLGHLARLVDEARSETETARAPIVIHRPVTSEVEVVRDGDGSFSVEGRAALRAVAVSDLTDEGALEYVQGRLRRLGVEKALVRAGVRDGDRVRLGPLEFTYRRDESMTDAAREAARGAGSDRPRRRERKGSGRSGEPRGTGSSERTR